tara:strand:- start:148 stop:798 length:651 start_codon:yes stop_codon:yes gene_type:complete
MNRLIEKNDLIKDKLKYFNNPIILELGVNRGGSTKIFLDYAERNNGKVFSIDIKDCSNVSNSKKWNFLKSDDLNYNYITSTFPEIIDKGVDILFVDSYHDPSHVKLLLEKWSTLLNKNGIIFFDDTESLPYRLKKNFSLSIVNDEIDKVIKNFYYSNYDQYFYTKHYIGAGLSFLEKKSEKGVQLSKFKVWNYGLINSQIYILIKKILFYIRNLRK